MEAVEMMGFQWKGAPHTDGATAERKSECSRGCERGLGAPRTHPGLQSPVCERGHRVLLAVHHGHFDGRGSNVKGHHDGSAAVECYLPLG